MSTTPNRQALVVGASRGLGLVLADELSRRGWHVIATTRRNSGELQAHAEARKGLLEVESLEMTSSGQLAALRERLELRLEGSRLDLLFVNAAIDRGICPSARSRPRCSPR